MPGKFEPGKDRGVPDPFHDSYALWLVVWIFSGFSNLEKRLSSDKSTLGSMPLCAQPAPARKSSSGLVASSVTQPLHELFPSIERGQYSMSPKGTLQP